MVKMRRKMVVAVFAGVLLLILGGGLASFAAEGIYSDFQPGARAQGMGGAFVGVADDVNAAWWNPAGIAQQEKGAFTFLYSNPFSISGFTLNYLSWVAPGTLDFVNGGFALSYLKVSSKLEENWDTTNEMVAPEMWILSLAGTAAEDKLYYGINLKGVSVSAEHTDEGTIRRGGVAGDIGLFYNITDRFSMGLVTKNLAASLGGEGFPRSLRVGFAGKFMDNKLILAADFNSKEYVEGKEEVWQTHFGIEWAVTDAVALRLGSDKGNFTAGFGFKFSLPGKYAPDASLDYVYTSNDDLESTSRFSFTILFK